MTIDGINQFGSLTTKTGKVLKFENFDKDNDGKITEEEYNSVLKEYDLDSVELSTVDKNKDKNVSKEEFTTWEQKIEMQNAINELKGQLVIDFAGEDDKYPNQVMSELKDFLESFANNYGNNDIDKMAEKFKEELPAKYTEIKDQVLSNTDSAVSSIVIEEVYAALTEGADLSKDTTKSIFKELDTEASKFVSEYKGDNLKEDLTNHLIEYINGSDAQKLSDATATWNNKKNSYGAYIDNNEFRKLKNDATAFLNEAINNGVILTLKDTVIRTDTAIKTALSKFTDGEELIAALDEAISQLSTASKMDNLKAADDETKARAAEKIKEEEKAQKKKENAALVDRVVDKLYENITAAGTTRKNHGFRRIFHGETSTISLPEETKQAIGKELEAEANRFIETCEDTELTDDLLESHLKDYMNSSDFNRMSEAINNWNTAATKYTGYLSSNEFASLKDDVTTLLKAAIEKGVTISLGGVDVKTENDITSALAKFTDGQGLLNAVNDAVKDISTKTKIESIAEAKNAEAKAKAEADFIAIKGEEYAVDSTQIDHTKFSNYGETYTGVGKNAKRDIRAYLEQEGLKSQMKAQIEDMLKDKGISFSEVASVFENAYADCLAHMDAQFSGDNDQTVAHLSDGTEISTGIHGMGNLVFVHVADTAKVLEAFIQMFNDTMAKAINDMNGTNTDLDLQNLNYNVISNEAEGDGEAEKLDSAFKKGTNYAATLRNKKLVENNMNNMFVQMKSQIMNKARAMCAANGIEFDNKVFETSFNNAKSVATQDAIEQNTFIYSFNPKNVMNKFTKEFQTSYTTWVESQKSKLNN